MFIHELLVRLSEHKHSNGADTDDIRMDNVIWSATLRAHIYYGKSIVKMYNNYSQFWDV